MRGVYLVAAELCRCGMIASPTSRSARGADILATTFDLKKTFSIEVKTTTTNRFWQLSEHAKSISSKSHIYVFVRIRSKKGKDEVTYYPVPSAFVRKHALLPDQTRSPGDQYRKGYTILEMALTRYEGGWQLFGVAEETRVLQLDR